MLSLPSATQGPDDGWKQNSLDAQAEEVLAERRGELRGPADVEVPTHPSKDINWLPPSAQMFPKGGTGSPELHDAWSKAESWRVVATGHGEGN